MANVKKGGAHCASRRYNLWFPVVPSLQGVCRSSARPSSIEGGSAFLLEIRHLQALNPRRMNTQPKQSIWFASRW